MRVSADSDLISADKLTIPLLGENATSAQYNKR